MNLLKGNQFTSSGLYVILAALTSKVFSVVTVIVTIHFLSSTQFGEVYLLLLLFGLSTQFGDFGLSINAFKENALLQQVTNLKISLSLIQVLVAFTIAAIVSVFVKHIAFSGLAVIAAASFVDALAFGMEVVLRKSMAYGQLSITSLVQQFLLNLVQILLLLLHFGYMAVLLASLCSQLFRLSILLKITNVNFLETLSRFHCSINFHLLSRNIAWSNATHFWTLNIDKFIIQTVMNRSGLALFSISHSVGRMVDMTITQPLKKVLIPIYASSGDISRFNYFNRMEYRWTSLLTTLWSTILWCVPSLLLVVLHGSWDKMILPIQVFSLAGILSPFINITGTAMLATGSAKVVKSYSAARLVAILCLLVPFLLIFHLVGAALLDFLIDGLIVIPYILLKAPTNLQARSVLMEGLPYLLIFIVCLTISRLEQSIEPNLWIEALSVVAVYFSCIAWWKGRVLKGDLGTIWNALHTS